MSKPVYTVRTTTIEGFRQWIENDDEDKFWLTEENVIQNIMGIERYNVKAEYGSAGHLIIEDAPKYKVMDGYVAGKAQPFVFTEAQVKPLLDFRKAHPLMTREIAVAKLYETPNFSLILTGTIDHCEGIVVRDTKFKFSSFKVEEFMESFQWKAYLDMIGLDHFVYDFIPVSGFNDIQDMGKSRIGDVESMPLRRYQGMEDDIRSVINEFVEFVTFKGLTEHLVITQAKSKRILAGNSSLKQYLP